MIARIWHGFAAPENANAYERITKDETFVNIRNRNIPGFREIQLLRKDHLTEVEFMTIMWFDSLESIKAYSGEAYERAVVPAKAQATLKRFDEITQIYQVLAQVVTQPEEIKEI
jgi:heme-degrading monooxygenase HmoA